MNEERLLQSLPIESTYSMCYEIVYSCKEIQIYLHRVMIRLNSILEDDSEFNSYIPFRKTTKTRVRIFCVNMNFVHQLLLFLKATGL